MNVVVTGTISYDFIMDFPGRFVDRIMPDKIHNISLSFLVDKLEKQFGGTSGNIGYSLNLLGINPILYASVGDDFALYEQFLKKNKIETSSIQRVPREHCSSYFVVTDKEDNQIGSFYTGATKFNHTLSLKHLKYKPDFVIITADYPAAMKKFVRECRALKLRYMYDPAFQISLYSSDELREGITGAQMLIGNDYEIEMIRKKLSITHAQLMTLVPVVITTLGSRGSIISERTTKESFTIKPAKPKDVTDPTGAGDAYRAGFVAGYLRGFDLKTCGQMGSVAAAYTVEKYGTMTHTYSKSTFARRYKENYKTTPLL